MASSLSIPSLRRQKKGSLFLPPETVETAHHPVRRADDDDASSSSSSDDSSVLSDGAPQRRRRRRPRASPWSKNGAPLSQQQSLEATMRDAFGRRDRIGTYLKRQTFGSSPYVQQILEREYAARRRLVDKNLRKLRATAQVDDAVEEQLRAHWYAVFLLPGETQAHPTKATSWFTATGIQIVLHSFAPATFSILVHSIVHVVLYDAVTVSLEAGKAPVLRLFASWPPGGDSFTNVLWSGLCFLGGLLLLRATGDLYYWSSSQGAAVVQMNFQNRRRALGTTPWYQSMGTRLVVVLRSYPILRAGTFLLGYTCCYVATTDLLLLLLHHGLRLVPGADAWNAAWLAQLPSAVHRQQQGVCLAPRDPNESLCSDSCQEELWRRANEFMSWKVADMEYTKLHWTTDSYYTYWDHWMMMQQQQPLRDGPSDDVSMAPLVPLPYHVLYCSLILLLSLFSLKQCGFKFWEKY